jgi:alpha-beta hydrolase superfamily lysophospholipase
MRTPREFQRIACMLNKLLAGALLAAGPASTAAAQSMVRGPVARVSIVSTIGTGPASPIPGAFSFMPLSVLSAPSLLAAPSAVPIAAAAPVAAAWTPKDAPAEAQAASARERFDQDQAQPAIVLVHGLNVNPEKMADLHAALESAGASVIRVTLSGHDGRGWRGADRRAWLRQIEQAHAEATALAGGAPVHLVAHSLGALIALDWQSGLAAPAFSRMVLLAPALSMTRLARALRLLSWLPDWVSLPSLALRGYRANRETSVGAYRALADSLKSLERAGFRNADRPALVLVDPRDELVSAAGLDALALTVAAGAWRVERVSNAGSTLRGRKHHIIFTEEALGASEWRRLVDAMRSHLGLR